MIEQAKTIYSPLWEAFENKQKRLKMKEKKQDEALRISKPAEQQVRKILNLKLKNK